MKTLTASKLRDLTAYDPCTGIFVWRHGKKQGQELGYGDGKGYKRAWLDGAMHKVHRLAWLYVHGVWPTGMIDHLNGDRSDNRIANLRDVNMASNLGNRTRANINNQLTGCLGVTRDKEYFRARICVNRKHIDLGLYKTLEEAKQAYDRAKNKSLCR